MESREVEKMTEVWSPLVLLAIGCEVAVSVVALLIYFCPLSWRFSKSSLSIPVEVVELASHTREVMYKSSFRDSSQVRRPQVVETSIPKEVEAQVLKTPSPEFAFKIGNPFELDDNTPGPGVYRLALKSGDHLPTWAENERPIRVDVEGEKIVYWFRYDGLKRIR